jgi:hypothetical protein
MPSAGCLDGRGTETWRLNVPNNSDVKELNFLTVHNFTVHIYMCLFLVLIYMNLNYLIRRRRNNYGVIYHAHRVNFLENTQTHNVNENSYVSWYGTVVINFGNVFLQLP